MFRIGRMGFKKILAFYKIQENTCQASAVVGVSEYHSLIQKSPLATSQKTGALSTDDQRRSSLSHNPRRAKSLPIPEDTYNSGPYMLCCLALGVAPVTCYVDLMHNRI
jgi:hypothetical protein